MGLYIQLDITTPTGSLRRLGTVEIIRQEPLDNPEDPDDEQHQYRARRVTRRGTDKEAFFEHRYGDGAYTCARLALEALNV